MTGVPLVGLLFFVLAGLHAPSSPMLAPTETQTFAVSFVQGADWKVSSFQPVRGVILLNGVVNGQQTSILLDNGSERTTIDSNFARQHGITLRRSGLRVRAGRTGLAADQAEGVTIALPNALTIKGDAAAIDLAPISRALGRPIAAVLGGDVLEKVALMIRPSRREVAILPSGRITPAAGAIAIPVENRNQVRASINGYPMLLRIDLGANGVVRLTDKAFDRVIPSSDIRHDGGQTTADGIERRTRFARATLQIGPINTTPSIDSGLQLDAIDGIVGNGFFSQADVLFDLGNGQVLIRPYSRP